MVLALSMALNNCGGRSDSGALGDWMVPHCTPGQQIACACESGDSGHQRCQSDGTYGDCTCSSGGSGGFSGSAGASAKGGSSASTGGTGFTTGGSGGSNTGTGGTGGSSTGGSAGASGAPVGSGIELSAGSSILIEAFSASSGIIIVLSDQIKLVARDGTLVKSLDSAREITAAAFDGGVLAIADAATLTIYDAELTSVVSGELIEACADAVLVNDNRFVCGPSNDWDRIFYTYDTQTAEFVASSLAYTYNGIPMRRVGTTNDFVTVTVDSSPSDFHLYSVVETGEPVFINESPYHGDFSITDTYAFYGNPPTHLVTFEGLMLEIYAEGCTPDESSFTSQCFVKDGALGTLTGSQFFLGMDQDAEGFIYGIVSAGGGSYFDPLCTAGCIVQKIDVAERSVVAQAIHDLNVGAIITTRHDAASNALIVGFRNAGDYYFSSDPYPGHQVRLLGYE